MAQPSDEVREIQFQKVSADPTSHYAEPEDVVTDNRFDTPQKVEILKQWGKDLLKLDPEVSAAGTRVKQVARAMEALGADPGDLKARAG